MDRSTCTSCAHRNAGPQAAPISTFGSAGAPGDSSHIGVWETLMGNPLSQGPTPWAPGPHSQVHGWPHVLLSSNFLFLFLGLLSTTPIRLSKIPKYEPQKDKDRADCVHHLIIRSYQSIWNFILNKYVLREQIRSKRKKKELLPPKVL